VTDRYGGDVGLVHDAHVQPGAVGVDGVEFDTGSTTRRATIILLLDG